LIHKCISCRSGNLKIDHTYPYHDIYNCRECHHIGYFTLEECCRNPLQIISILRHNHDHFFLYHQCLNCGGAEKTKPLKAKEYSEQIRSEFNQWSFEEWKALKKIEGNEIYDGIKYSNYKNSNRYKYHQYLLSDDWKEKRKLVMERDSNICQFCRILPAVDVHHLHYDNLFNEPLEDLRGVCLDCHRLIHHKSYGSVNP
jgi:nitrate/TMAO reductase-like tetraheme cytochrome c subunit